MNILKQIHFCTGVEPGVALSVAFLRYACCPAGASAPCLRCVPSALSYSWDVG